MSTELLWSRVGQSAVVFILHIFYIARNEFSSLSRVRVLTVAIGLSRRDT